jgi:CBS domain-containing protein
MRHLAERQAAAPRTTERHRHRDIRDVPVLTVMSHPVLAVQAFAFFDEALRILVCHGVRHLAVVDPAGRCVGLIGDRVLAAEWAARPMAFGRRIVAHLCDDRQPIVDREMTVATAARVMRGCDTDAVVVVDRDGYPVGVLTSGDVIALLAESVLERSTDDV